MSEMGRMNSYTRRAMEAIGKAASAAQEYRHDHLGPEHLLLGLLEVKGRALSVLRDLGADTDQIREHVERRGRFPTREKRTDRGRAIAFSADLKRVFETAAEEAAALGRDWVGTEHLLLALLRAEGSIAARALSGAAVTVQGVRDLVADPRNQREDTASTGKGTAHPQRGSSDFDRAFEDLLQGHPMWHAVGTDRDRLVAACIDYLTPERVSAWDFSNPGPGRATWVLDQLLPLGEVELFRRLNGYERWLHTLYALFRRSPQEMDSVTAERFKNGEHIAVEAAWVETRATDEDLLGWQADCQRRGWPSGDILAIVEYCRRSPDLDRLLSHADRAPGPEVPIILDCAMRLVADSVARTDAPEPGLDARLREAGFEALANAIGRTMKSAHVRESSLADVLWVEQQGPEDVDRLIGSRSPYAAGRLARVVPGDRPDIWKRAFAAYPHSDEDLVLALCEWCTPSQRHVLVPHFDHEDIEHAASAFEAYLALAPMGEVARLARERGRAAWQLEILDRWMHAPPQLRPARRRVRRPHEIVFDYREFDPFDVRQERT